jgi:outer membrane biosynthesis protein TonB
VPRVVSAPKHADDVAAKHTPPQDASFRASLARHLGGGVALIVLVAVAFYGIGQVGQEDPTPVAADVPDESEDEEPEDELIEEPEEAPEEEPEDDEPEEEPEEPDPAEDEPEEPSEEDDDTDSEDTEADPETEESDAAASEPEEADEPEDRAPAAHAPAEISLQVLDGVGTDGGNAASQMAQRLRDGGFNVVAQNPAIAYQTTTVLWTSGNEDKARQVAAEIGAGDVRPQPGNLSESVDVHVVVGADRA